MIKDQVNQAIKDAMRSGAKERLGTLRLIASAIKDFEVNNRKPVEDADVISILRKSIKSRRDSIQQFQDGGRMDLVEKEQSEIKVVEEFLPADIGDDEIRAIVDSAIAETGATQLKQMGIVMKAVLVKLAGRADGSVVNKFVKERLEAAAPRA